MSLLTMFIGMNKQAAGGASGRGLWFGGSAGPRLNNIDYVQIPTLGNALDFGDLAQWVQDMMACSSDTRAIISGGDISGLTDNIDYVTMATLGNAVDFGVLPFPSYLSGGGGNVTRGITTFGRRISGGSENEITYVTIATTGNAVDFGDTMDTNDEKTAVTASSTRLVAMGNGGLTVPAEILRIEYITIATTGNASDFGDCISGACHRNSAAMSDGTRGVGAGGNESGVHNSMTYITIATTGNATDFGDTTVANEYMRGTSDATRGVFHRGSLTDLWYITIQTTGNTTDFGDLTSSRTRTYSAGDSHGGLQ